MCAIVRERERKKEGERTKEMQMVCVEKCSLSVLLCGRVTKLIVLFEKSVGVCACRRT